MNRHYKKIRPRRTEERIQSHFSGLKTGRGFIGMEINSGPKLSGSDYRPLLTLAAKLKDRWLGGLGIYRGARIEKLADPNIWAVPSYRLF